MSDEYQLPKQYTDWIKLQKQRKINQSINGEYIKISFIWDKLTEFGGGNSMSERFIAVIAYYSELINDAIEEWDLYNKESKITINNCICSQNIEYNYFIKNKYNNNILVIGSSCISKFCNDDVVEVHKISVKKRKYDGDKRMCQNCCNYRISSNKDSYVTFCKTCYKAGFTIPSESYRTLMNYKPCSDCGLNLINSDESWKTKCKNCFKEKKTTFRQCNICKENNISLVEPTWKNKCSNCYIKEKNTSRECSICKEKKIPINEPSWKDKCGGCYYKRQKIQ